MDECLTEKLICTKLYYAMGGLSKVHADKIRRFFSLLTCFDEAEDEGYKTCEFLKKFFSVARQPRNEIFSRTP